MRYVRPADGRNVTVEREPAAGKYIGARSTGAVGVREVLQESVRLRKRHVRRMAERRRGNGRTADAQRVAVGYARQKTRVHVPRKRAADVRTRRVCSRLTTYAEIPSPNNRRRRSSLVFNWPYSSCRVYTQSRYDRFGTLLLFS